jgi:hypothetical protein
MRAWVAKRREGGALLDKPLQLGTTPAPFELVVVEVTDQGARRPTKVARLVPVGERVAIAQLVAPRLVWGEGWDLVLSGTEESLTHDGLAGVSQSWICRLAPPQGAVGLLARQTHKEGVELKRGAILDRYNSTLKGQLEVRSVRDSALGRHTMCANFTKPDGTPQAMSGPLLDVELAWMSADRFALAGFQQLGGRDAPARLLRQGWLCEYEIGPEAPPQR